MANPITPVPPGQPPETIPTSPSQSQKIDEIDEHIAFLAAKANLLEVTAKISREAPPDAKKRILDDVRQLLGVPEGSGEGEVVEFIKISSKGTRDELTRLRVERAALEPRTLSLLDKEIVDLAGADSEGRLFYRRAIEYREIALNVLQRLYFETQGGPTRRVVSRPGDRPMILEALDDSVPSYMVVNFWKNISAFYEQLPPEDKLANERVFRSLFEKLKKALPLFYLKDRFAGLALSKEAASQVQALAVDGSVLLPGGPLNHAIVFEVKREGADTYSFRLFNSGRGLERHHGGRGGKYSNVFIRNIPASKLGKDFFDILYGAYLPSGSESSELDSIYHHLQSLGPIEFDESFHYGQGGIGACSYQSIVRWAKREMGTKLYRRVREYALQALLDDCDCRFGGLVRRDGSIRTFKDIKPSESMGLSRGAEDRFLPEGVDEDTVIALIEFAKRSVQKVHRNILIDKAVEKAMAIPDGESRRLAFLSVIETEEIRATIVDPQDRCLVLLKIAEAIFLQNPAFLEEIRPAIYGQIIDELDRISNPELKGSVELEVARALLTQGKEVEAVIHIDNALNLASLVGDKRRDLLVWDITHTLLLEAKTLAVHGDKKASLYLGAAEIILARLSGKAKYSAIVEALPCFLSLGNVQKVKEMLGNISDPKKRQEQVLGMMKALQWKAEDARSRGSSEEATEILNQAVEIAALLNPGLDDFPPFGML